MARQATASETITQAVVMFRASRRDRSAKEKRDLLRALIDGEGEACTNAIIFCNRKTDVDIVAKSLNKHGYNASPIHGDLEQSQRMRTLDGFRDGSIRLLVASDVAARGLDIPAVSHVFNFDVPGHAEDYVHRIGRTGRAGREGKAITLCATSDEKNLAAVERLVEKDIPRQDNPLASAAPAAEEQDEKPARSRSRRRSASKDEDKSARDSQPEDNQARDSKPSDSKADDAKPRESKGRESRGRGRRGKDGDNVVGMGDHLPSFIEKSFEERMVS